MIVTHTLPNGGRYTIVSPRSKREWENLADNILPDPEAAHFNSKHPLSVALGDKREYCKRKGYAPKRRWDGKWKKKSRILSRLGK